MFRLEEEVLKWRAELAGVGGLRAEDADELESHMWDLVEGVMYAGNAPEEAFTMARERMGEPSAIGEDFAVIYREEYMDIEKKMEENRESPEELETLYHQKPQAFASCLPRVLASYPESPMLRAWKARLSYVPFLADRRKAWSELALLLVLCLASAIAVKLPFAWGIDVWKVDAAANSFYPRNLPLLFMPMIAAYYLVRQKPGARLILAVAIAFAVSIAAANFMPAVEPFHTRILSAIHLPLFLWLAVGLAFCGREWRSPSVRMDFLRYSGELFIYTVLILLGGGVLTVFTLGIFDIIGIDIHTPYVSWIAAVGLFAAPIVATHLTEIRRELVENFAPTLSFIFTPLFLVTLVVFLLVMAGLRKNPYTDRNFLLIFNGMLVLVIALVIFNISERKLSKTARPFDAMNAVLIVVALAIDAIALSAIVARLSSYGISPNKLAVLGANLLLLANLLGLGVQYARFFARRVPFPSVENWTVRFLPAYLAWFGVVAFLFPLVFRFA